jgi:hypothetical protein
MSAAASPHRALRRTPCAQGARMPAGHPRFRRASSCPHEVWGGPTAGTTAVVGSPLGFPVASDCYLRGTSALSHRIPGGQGVVASENGVKEGTRARPSRVRIWHGPRGRCVTIGGSPARLEKRDSGSSVAGRVWPAGRGEGKHQFVCIESLLTSGAGSAARAGARGESCIDTYYFGDSVPIDRDDPRANPRGRSTVRRWRRHRMRTSPGTGTPTSLMQDRASPSTTSAGRPGNASRRSRTSSRSSAAPTVARGSVITTHGAPSAGTGGTPSAPRD